RDAHPGRVHDPALLARWRRAAAPLEALAAPVPEARWALLSGAVAATDAPAAFDRGLAAAALAERWGSGGFDDFHAPSHDRTAERFARAGQALRESLTSVLPAALVDRRPFRPGSIIGRAAALDRELNRTRGGASVRQLIRTHGAVIAEITPCVLVSPDSLARFVPPGAMDFDLVVFDEASQIRVPDAIGALGRARACVVAGDSKQLPPTEFAHVTLEEDEEPADEFTVVPDEESILGECVQAGLPRQWLSWHYRSTDESLIAFSNDRYYEGRLSSFPASPADRFDSGISFTRVDGHFRRSVARDGGGAELGLLRTNPVEAAAVVEEVLRRWRQRERSIGVVTFNAPQRNLIQRLLWESEVEGVAESLVLADDGLFVKNLENVQGDERDVIIFSTAFSANAQGTLPLNFGPLNRAGGERRLNVAITRARRRVMVFSSFDPEDIRVEQTNSVGVHHLRAYLEVAKYGTPPVVAPAVGARDRHREDIAEALRERGLEVATAVGLSDFRIDLVVTDPSRGDRAALAVLLDGPGWARRATTGDRDGLPDQVLRGIMGWPAVHRVWLPEWLTDRTGTLDRVASALAGVDGRREVGEATIESVFAPYAPGEESPVLDSGEEPAATEDPADPLQLFGGSDDPDEGPYAEPDFGTRPRSRLDGLAWPGQAQAQTIELIGEIVDACGPISLRRLARLVVGIHGLTRLTETRLAQIRPIIPEDLRRDPEGFLWPAARDPLIWQGYRSGSNAKDRPLEDIALREIANAQCRLVRLSVGISTEELHRETTRLFGGTRVTETGRGRLEAALDHAVAEGRLKLAGGLVVPA
ncbi:MAG: AAA domain-containing protein, partial [Propionibacteriaceae bacterium]|nr:AAA domain-containing protein [Propionibacteriaceae bacterium]